MPKSKALTLRDFRNDWIHIDVSTREITKGDRRSKVINLIRDHYMHIADDCIMWISNRNIKITKEELET